MQDVKEQELRKTVNEQATKIDRMKAAIQESHSKHQEKLNVSTHTYMHSTHIHCNTYNDVQLYICRWDVFVYVEGKERKKGFSEAARRTAR